VCFDNILNIELPFALLVIICITGPHKKYSLMI